jgi:biotin-dependent carboxylase-like uncharacterized protein
MDRGAFAAGGALLQQAGRTAVEFTAAGVACRAEGPLRIGCSGGQFTLSVNGNPREWPARLGLDDGDVVEVTPGPSGNYGYLRFNREIDVPSLLGSRSTNLTVGLGGFKGRALKAGDRIAFGEIGPGPTPVGSTIGDGPIRVLWGLHADLFDGSVRNAFATNVFAISTGLDRMGVRLTDPQQIFRTQRRLSLVSDAIVPGDIQILGDGTPIVLMRDHQPTGGYPRIATVVSADLDRFAQLRPGTEVRFRPVTLERAR